MLAIGTVRPGRTIYVPFDSFAAATGAPATISNFAVGDIKIYKDGSTTERASTSGYTLLDTDGIDFDALTGINGFSVDLADNTTAGFYTAGGRYFIVVGPITVDAQTVNFIAATFNIGYDAAVLNTTIATLASQTSFTLTTGPADDNALKGMWVQIHALASAVQSTWAVISAYTGATKTVTLGTLPGTTYTIAAGDNISIMGPVPLQPVTFGTRVVIDAAGLADANTVKVGPTGAGAAQTARDVGASVLLAAGSGTGQLDFTSGVVKSNVTQLLGTAWLTPGTAGTPDVNAKLHGGTAQTGRDIGASVLLSTGTGTGQLDFTSGVVKSNLVQILASAITGTAAQLVAAFTKFFNVATPTGTINSLPDAVPSASGGLPLVSDLATPTSIADSVWDEATSGHSTAGTTGKALTDAGSAGDPWSTALPGAYGAGTAGKIVGDNITGNSFTRLGAPAGASVSADIAAAKVDTAAIKAKTDNLPAAPASTTNITAGIITTVTNLTNAPTVGDLTATMKTSVTTAATAATPIAASVTGAVGSVTGLTASDVGAIKAKTDNLPAAPASTTNITAGVMTTVTNLTNAPTAGDLTATMKASVTTAVPSANQTADQVWDEVLATHLTSGSTGNALNASGAAGDPWSTSIPGAYGAGSAGKILGDNLNATVSSRASQTSVGTPAGVSVAADIAAVKVDTAAILVDTGTTLDARIPAALISGRIDANLGAISSSATAADNLEEGSKGLVPGTCAAGCTTTSIVTNLTEATDNHYNGRVITFTGGALLGQTSSISDYVGSTKTLTIVALTEAPASTDPFVIS